NCRSCHGINGLGQDEGGIAPRLNNVAFLVLEEGNQFNVPATPAGDERKIHDFLFNTIACGRSNTAMPLWSERYGGPLSETQIGYIASMIMQGRWDLVEESNHHHDEPIMAQHAEALTKFDKPYTELTPEQVKQVDAAIEAGTATPVSALNADQLHRAEEALAKSVYPEDPSTLNVTSQNCGQYGAAVLEFRDRNPLAGAAGAPAGGGGTPAAGGSDPVALGKTQATANGCVACHTIDGKASVGPTWKGLAGKTGHELADGSSVTVDDAYLKESITTPNAKVVKGFAANVMPATFGNTLKPEQIDQIIAYIKSLK
ncbi:MAG: c-type cytochrome, partial [Dehalococcoidia bacterium]